MTRNLNIEKELEKSGIKTLRLRKWLNAALKSF